MADFTKNCLKREKREKRQKIAFPGEINEIWKMR